MNDASRGVGMARHTAFPSFVIVGFFRPETIFLSELRLVMQETTR
jgi:hypothetical protein